MLVSFTTNLPGVTKDVAAVADSGECGPASEFFLQMEAMQNPRTGSESDHPSPTEEPLPASAFSGVPSAVPTNNGEEAVRSVEELTKERAEWISEDQSEKPAPPTLVAATTEEGTAVRCASCAADVATASASPDDAQAGVSVSEAPAPPEPVEEGPIEFAPAVSPPRTEGRKAFENEVPVKNTTRLGEKGGVHVEHAPAPPAAGVRHGTETLPAPKVAQIVAENGENAQAPKVTPIATENGENSPVAKVTPIVTENSENSPVAKVTPIVTENGENSPVAKVTPIVAENGENAPASAALDVRTNVEKTAAQFREPAEDDDALPLDCVIGSSKAKPVSSHGGKGDVIVGAAPHPVASLPRTQERNPSGEQPPSPKASPVTAAFEPVRIHVQGQAAPTVIVAAAENETFVREISQRIRAQVLEGGGAIRIRLQPDRFGHLEITAEITGAGVVARVAAESESVKQYLENNLPLLQHHLQEQGVRVDRIEFALHSESQSMSEHAGRSGHEGSGQSGSRPRMSAKVARTLSDEPAGDSSQWIVLNPNVRFHTIA